MAVPPVVIPVTLDTSKATALLQNLKSQIIASIKGGFQEGGTQAATAGLADSIKQLTEAFKAAAIEGGKLQSAVQKEAQATSQSTAVTQQAISAQRQRAKALSVSFAAALKGVSAQQRFTQSLLKVAASAGISISEIDQLAASTGAFTDSQLDAARKVAVLEGVYKGLVAELKQGKATIEEVELVTKNLVKANTALEQSLKTTSNTQEQVNQARAKGFVNSLAQKNAEQQVTVELLRQAQAAGNTREQLERIARASNAFTQEEIKLANELSELSARFDILSSKINRTEQEQRELQQVTGQLATALGKQNQRAETGVKSFGQLQVAFAKFNNVLAAVRNVVQIVDQVLGGLYRTARQGAVVDQTTTSFNRFASEIVGIPDLLERTSEAAKGTISDFELASQTLTLISGLTPDVAKTFSEALVGSGDFSTSLLDVARVAQILNPALGDMDFFLQSLSIGIKRNERRWIDNLGIVISARESYQRFSETTGKSVLELTAQDKQLATLTETLRVGKLLIDQVGDSVDSQVDTFARFETSWENLRDSISVAVKDAILPYLQLINGEFTPSVDNATESLLDFNRELANQQEREPITLVGGQFERISREADAIRRTLEDARDLRAAPPTDIVDFLFGISNREAEKQIGDLAILLAQEISDPELLQGTLENIFRGEETGLAKALIAEIEEAGIISRRETGALAAGAGLEEIIPIFLDAAKAQSRLADGTNFVSKTFDNFTSEARQAALELQDFKKIIEEISDEALADQLKIVEEYNDALDDLGRQKALDKLSASFVDFGNQSFLSLGLSEDAILDFRVRIGDLDQDSAELEKNTRTLNEEIRRLFVLFKSEGIDDVNLIADAFDALRLGLVSTSAEAISFAQDQNLVATELDSAREAAAFDSIALEELEETTKAATEATDKLRDSLSGIVESGFDRARGAISDYIEALKNKEEAEGESRTVTIDNSRRIAEINEKLFSDLDKDTREGLENRLKELREAGQDVSQEYADILDNLDNALSRSERDTLIEELFDLQERQGLIFSGVFGADPDAIKEFEEDAQEAIRELIEARRETIVSLFTEAREAQFEIEIGLLVAFDLISPDEAELLILERKIFDTIDLLFGEGSVFRISPKATIDFGAILLEQIGVEGIADLAKRIETLIGEGGLGDSLSLALPFAFELVAEGTVDVEDTSRFISGVLDELEKQLESPDGTPLPRFAVTSALSDLLKITPAEAQDIFSELQGKVKEFVEEPEKKEIEIVAETDEAQRVIQEFLDAIPDEIIINLGFNDTELPTRPPPATIDPDTGVPRGFGDASPPAATNLPSSSIGDLISGATNPTPAFGPQTTNNVSSNSTVSSSVDRSITNITNVTIAQGSDVTPVPDFFA